MRASEVAYQCLLDVSVGDRRKADALHAALDGADDVFGLFAHHDDMCLFVRLLDDLEQFVGSIFAHLLGQPDDHDTIVGLERLGR